MDQYEDVYQELEDGGLKKIERGSLTRRCSPMEWMHVQEKETQYLVQQYIEIESQNPIDKSAVESAVKLLVVKNPVLQLGVVKRSEQYWFKLLKEPLFNLAFETGDVEEIFRRNLNEKFETKREAPWEIIFTYPTDKTVLRYGIILRNDHTIADAAANYTLLGYLARYLAQDQVLTKQNATPLPGSMLKPLAVSKYMRIPYAIQEWWQLACSLIRHNFPTLSHIFKNFEPRGGDPSLLVQYEHLTESDTKQLLGKCKVNGVSVNSCIAIASCISLIRVANDKERSKNKHHHLSLVVPINCRQYYPKSHSEIIGSYTRMLYPYVQSTENLDETFWFQARALHDDIRKTIRTKSWEADTLYPQLLNWVLKRNVRHAKEDESLLQFFHFMMNNMGCIDKYFKLPDKSSLEVVAVRRMAFGVHYPNPFVIGLDTFRNKIHLKISYSQLHVSTEDVQAVFKYLLSILKEIVDSENF